MGGFLPLGDPATWTLANVRGLIENIANLALTLGGAIAVLFIIWGAFQYFTAFGSEEKAEQGKKTVTWAIIGVVFIIASRLIIDQIFALVQP